MADPFVAEIRIFPFNFAPKGWAFCAGQLLPISQNTALFSLLGVTYGGDGKSTFALPDLQGNAAMHPGQGQGLSQRFLGEMSGTQAVTLIGTEMPVHAHGVGRASTTAGDATVPTNAVWAQSGAGRGAAALYIAGPATGKVNQFSLAPTGGGLPHNNMQPYLTLNFCIALQGVFPARP
jgi:microcystin-dependent protein